MSKTNFVKWEDAPDLLRPQEAAVLLRIGKNKIYEVANSKGFPKVYLGGKCFLIPKDLLFQWIEKKAKS